MSHYVTIRFDFSDTSKYASIPLYIGFPATFIPFFIYIQSELSPLHSCSILIKCLLIAIQTALKMNNKIAVILALADVKYSLNDLEKHYKTFCGL